MDQFDWSKAKISGPDGKPVGAPEEFDWSKATVTQPPSLARRAVDTIGIPLAKGIIGVPEFATGLADIATGGAAGKALESAGVRFKDAKGALDEMLSPHQQAINQGLADTKGFLPTVGYALSNPSTILGAAVESAPSMLGRAAIGRGALAAGQGALARTVGEKVAPIVAGAVGEGLVGAGSSAEQIRQQSPSGDLSGQQAALAAGSGALTGLIGGAGGALARRMGLTDIDTALVAGKMAGSGKGVASRVAGGAVSEGLLEELPQSAQEQVAQNLALGRPWDEGVAEAGAMGALVGGVMGGGANLLAGKPPSTNRESGGAGAGQNNADRTPPADFAAERTAVVQAALDPNAGPLTTAAGIGELTGANDAMRAQKMAAAAEEAAQMAAKGRPGEAKSKGGTLAQDAQATNDAEEQAQMAGRTPRTAGASLGASGELSAMQMALQQARPLGQTQAEARADADAPPNQQAIPTAPASLAPAAPATPDNVISPADQTVQPSVTPSLGTDSPVRPASSAPGIVAVDQSATETPAASRKKSAPTPLPAPSLSDRQSTTESVSTQPQDARAPSTPGAILPLQNLTADTSARAERNTAPPVSSPQPDSARQSESAKPAVKSTSPEAAQSLQPAPSPTASSSPQFKALGNGTYQVVAGGKEIGRANLADSGGHLTSIRIDPEWQRQGIGTRLHEFIESDIGKPLQRSPTHESPAEKALQEKRRPAQENANVQAAQAAIPQESGRPLAVAQGTSGDSAVRPAVQARPNADAGVSGTATPDVRSDAVRGVVPAGAAKTDATVDSAAGVTDEKGTKPTAAAQDKTAENFADWAGKVAKRQAMEAHGQDILDDMEERGIKPQDVAKQFWSDTYFKLPAQAQDRFQKMLKAHTGLQPGDPIERDTKTGKLTNARDWQDIANLIDVGNSAAYLEGTERGFVALMQDGNRRLAGENAGQSAPTPQPVNAVAETPAAKSSDLGRFIKPLNDATAGGRATKDVADLAERLHKRIKSITGVTLTNTPGRDMTRMDAVGFIADYRAAPPSLKPLAKQLAEHAIAQFPDAKLSLLTRQEQKAAADAEKKAANVRRMQERREAAKQAKANPPAVAPSEKGAATVKKPTVKRTLGQANSVSLKKLLHQHGIQIKEIRDITGEGKGRHTGSMVGTFRKNGRGVDEWARILVADGWLKPMSDSERGNENIDADMDDVRDLIRRVLDGEDVYTIEEQADNFQALQEAYTDKELAESGFNNLTSNEQVVAADALDIGGKEMTDAEADAYFAQTDTDAEGPNESGSQEVDQDSFGLQGQTNAEAVAAEKAKAQADADAAKEPASTGPKVKADQVDLFNTQGGIFDQPPPKDAPEALGNRGDFPTTNSKGQPIHTKGVQNFWNWFAGSKTVDAEGRPVPVYHSTGEKFTTFNLKKATQGVIWVTSDRAAAEAGEVGAQSRGIIMELYANIKNPAGWKEYNDKSIGELIRDGYDGVILPDADGTFTAIVFERNQVKSATGNKGTYDGTKNSTLANKSDRAQPQSFDHTLYGMVNSGATAQELLARIATGSKSKLTRAIAHLLIRAKINPTVILGSIDPTYKFKTGNQDYSASYVPSKDLVTLHRFGNVERDLVHELVHSSSVRALRAGGLAARQFNALYAHAKKFALNPDAYGFESVEEFIAEAFSNPKFQQELKSIPALHGMRGQGAWGWFVNIVRGILGLSKDQTNSFSQALEIGEAVIAENMATTQAQSAEALGNIATTAINMARGVFGGKPPTTPPTPAQGSAFASPDPSRLDNFIFTMQDKHIDTKRVQEAITAVSGQIQDDIDVRLQEELYISRAAKETKDFLDKELKPLFADMAARKVEIEDFEKFLHARHAEERNIQIATINPNLPDGGSGMDTADAKAFLAGLNMKQRADYNALAKQIDAINDGTRQALIDYGLESQTTIDAWESAYKHYVPLQREDMESGMGTGQGFSVKGQASKRATGSTRAVENIVGNIAMQRERAIVRGNKNIVSNALVGLAEANPNPDFWKVDQPPKIKYVDERTGLVAEMVDPLYKSRENVVMARLPDANGNIIERSVIFNERDERAARMAKSLKNLDSDHLGELLSNVAKATRFFASINTQYNVIFGAVNLTRDAQQAMFNLSTTPIAGKQAEVAKNILPALKGIYLDLRAIRQGNAPTSAWAQLFEEFQNEGGQTGYMDMFRTSQDRADAIQREFARVTEGKAKQFGRAVFDWISDYNSAMENATRLAAYKVAKDSGLTNQRAASLAKNLTVNFNRKGQITTQAGALYAFYNASSQGTARLIETLKGPLGQKIIYGGITLGAMQALLLAAAGFDDDDPPEFVRERSLIIPVGGKRYITIPMPLGLHFIPNIGRVSAEFVLSGFRDPAKRVMQLGNVFADAFNPVGSAGLSLQTLTPTVVDPLTALAENRDWTGKPIAREDMSSLNPTPGHTRAKDTASYFSKTVSKALNFASGGTNYKPGLFSPTPDQLDYLIGQVTGGVGREVMKAEQSVSSVFTGDELPTYKIPLVGRFYGNADQQASHGNAFYKHLKDINAHEAEIKGRRKHGEPVAEYIAENPEARLVMAANAAERQVSQLRRRKRELTQSAADREQIKAIDLQISARMKVFNEQVKRVSEAGR